MSPVVTTSCYRTFVVVDVINEVISDSSSGARFFAGHPLQAAAVHVAARIGIQ